MQSHQLFHYSVATLKLQPLLRHPLIYDKIFNNLHLLVNAKQIKIYGYAILPHRLELLWELTNNEENESPHVQFLKLSSFDFLEVLRQNDKKLLDLFCIDMLFHKIQFWQRTQSPVKINSEYQASMVLQNMHDAAAKCKTEKQSLFSSEYLYKHKFDNAKLVRPYQDYFVEQVEEVI